LAYSSKFILLSLTFAVGPGDLGASGRFMDDTGAQGRVGEFADEESLGPERPSPEALRELKRELKAEVALLERPESLLSILEKDEAALLERGGSAHGVDAPMVSVHAFDRRILNQSHPLLTPLHFLCPIGERGGRPPTSAGRVAAAAQDHHQTTCAEPASPFAIIGARPRVSESRGLSEAVMAHRGCRY